MTVNYVMTNRTTIAIAVFALAAGPLGAADIPALSDDSVIIVAADESWEGDSQAAFHFRGNFEIRMPSWTLMADLATVYGTMDDPTSVVADGALVHFAYHYTEAGKPSIIEGECRHLEYDRERNVLTLTGDAKISTERRILQSSKVTYNLNTRKLEAGGPEGVHVTIQPGDAGNP